MPSARLDNALASLAQLHRLCSGLGLVPVAAGPCLALFSAVLASVSTLHSFAILARAKLAKLAPADRPHCSGMDLLQPCPSLACLSWAYPWTGLG